MSLNMVKLQQTNKQLYTHINSEVISNSEVSQLAKIYIPSSNSIQYEDIRWEAQGASCSAKQNRKITKQKQNRWNRQKQMKQTKFLPTYRLTLCILLYVIA